MSTIFNTELYPASKANDGTLIPNDDKDSLAHTWDEVNPWWRVDLGMNFCIWNVTIVNRGRKSAISSYIILAWDFSNYYSCCLYNLLNDINC